MPTEKQRLIFISYSKTNRGFALELARELKASGFLIWFDQIDIPKGARWDDEIEKALTECEIFLVILTQQSIASHNVKDEIGYAIDSNKRILPILLEKVNVPFRLRRFQYVNFTNKSNNEGIDVAKQLLRELLDDLSEPEVPPQQTPATTQQSEVDRPSVPRSDPNLLAQRRLEAIQKAREQEQQARSMQAAPQMPSSARMPPQSKSQGRSSRSLFPMMAVAALIVIFCLGGGYMIWVVVNTKPTPVPTTVFPITVVPPFTPIVVATTGMPTVPVPTTPAAPTITPIEPVQTIINYWNYVSIGKYNLAWEILSPSFQINLHEGKLEIYEASKKDDNYCKIDTANGKQISNDGNVAVVTITVIYFTGACPGKETPHDFQNTLMYNTVNQKWQLGKIVEIK